VENLQELTRQLLSCHRQAGTPNAERARALIAGHLRGLGYMVELQRFSFSPASLSAFPVFGAGVGGLALILLPLLHFPGVPSWAAPAAWAGGLLVLLIIAGGIGVGWVSLGEAPREDANLVATRGTTTPRRWIVAHLDSKAQGHSMAGRLIAVWTTILTCVGLSVLVAFRLGGPLPLHWPALAAGLALVSGFLAGKGRLRGQSPGARDNGTGVIAALTAAEASTDPGIGILITGAEEFGLVGARVFARFAPTDTEFVNIDTVDQEGTLYLVSHNARGARLASALGPRLAQLELPLRHRRLPLGIFVDSAPLSRIGPAVTVGRLTWTTLRQIHTPADTADALSLEAARRVGRALV
jgi:hypothetical protein